MDKQRADSIIENYIRPIYGFSLNKMGNSEEAEELAGRIIIEIYHVLRHKDDFVDLNRYVFKIAHNIWTKYLQEKTTLKRECILNDTALYQYEKNVDESYIDRETEGLLRREIAYLSTQQRSIVVDYYYKGMKIKDIATELDLSEGTIKWNLFDAKKELKNGMKAIRTIGNLGVNPIKFRDMGHSGTPGKKGDTSNFLSKVITQNIAYAAYHQPLTIKEIAEELGISPIFIEDEVNELEAYGFMNLLPGGKYQTQILILEPSSSEMEAFHELSVHYAKILYEKYYKAFLDLEPAIKALGFYYPNQDYNCLLWTLIPYATQFLHFPQNNKIDADEVQVYRKDGGKYIAVAGIDKPLHLSFDERKYNTTSMIRGNGEDDCVEGWQVGTYWSGRKFDWRDNLYTDYLSLFHFIKGKLVESEVTAPTYSRLLEKEYLVKTDSGYKVNIVYLSQEEKSKLNALVPKPSEEIRNLCLEYDEKIYQFQKVGQPLHMHKTIRYQTQDRLATLWPYVFEHMLTQDVLKAPTKEQQKGISTILHIQ